MAFFFQCPLPQSNPRLYSEHFSQLSPADRDTLILEAYPLYNALEAALYVHIDTHPGLDPLRILYAAAVFLANIEAQIAGADDT